MLADYIAKWFQDTVLENYGDPEVRHVQTGTKTEWEYEEVPYTETKTTTEIVDKGIKGWVVFVFIVLFMGSLVLSSVSSGFFALTAISVVFIIIGNKKFRNVKEEETERTVEKTKTEKVSKEVPVYGEEIIPQDWAIRKMGAGSLQLGVYEANNMKLLYGVGIDLPEEEFNLPYLKDCKEFMREFKSLEDQLENIPYVLNGDKEAFEFQDEENTKGSISLTGLEKDIMNHFISTAQIFLNKNSKPVSAQLMKEGELHKMLVKSTEAAPRPSDDFFIELDNSLELKTLCEDWLDKWESWKAILNSARFDSVYHQMVPEFAQFGNLSHYSSFNFYCPSCNAEVAQELMNRDYSVMEKEDHAYQRFHDNTRCHYQVETNSWLCPMCHEETHTPIPYHKVLDELLLPVYESLMHENKIEREKSYSEVRKKEIENKSEMEKEVQQMYFQTLNQVIGLNDEMDKMSSEIEGEVDAIQFVSECAIKMKNLQSSIIIDIENSNQHLKHEIALTTQRVVAEMDRVKEREMSLLSEELRELSKAKRFDDERRDSVQRELLFAAQEQMVRLSAHFGDLIKTNSEGFGKVEGSIRDHGESRTREAEEHLKAQRQASKQTSEKLDNLAEIHQTGIERLDKSNKVSNGIELVNAMASAAQLIDPVSGSIAVLGAALTD